MKEWMIVRKVFGFPFGSEMSGSVDTIGRSPIVESFFTVKEDDL